MVTVLNYNAGIYSLIPEFLWRRKCISCLQTKKPSKWIILRDSKAFLNQHINDSFPLWKISAINLPWIPDAFWLPNCESKAIICYTGNVPYKSAIFCLRQHLLALTYCSPETLHYLPFPFHFSLVTIQNSAILITWKNVYKYMLKNKIKTDSTPYNLIQPSRLPVQISRTSKDTFFFGLFV